MIGSQLPRDEAGKFDWEKATMYWKFVYWLDSWLGYWDVVDGSKED